MHTSTHCTECRRPRDMGTASKCGECSPRCADGPDGPDEGSPAPDFDLALLDGDGERVRLSGLRGRPVGLIFGSYT